MAIRSRVPGPLRHRYVAKALVRLESVRATIAIVRAGHVAYYKRMFKADAVEVPALTAALFARFSSREWPQPSTA